ncbi:MAG: glycosyltransferase [Proteobacteria bacterium]|nr:glycosyltransferase [Pseudomonadota bacterium]
MTGVSVRRRQSKGIAFVGTYLPRLCGIATFTYDLAEAVAKQAGPDQNVIAVAMNDRLESYDYPSRVQCEIHQESHLDYSRAADFLNSADIDVVSLQHEYGIFGSDSGSKVLMLLRKIRKPVIVTCHTVKRQPLPHKKMILTEIATKADKLVVMSKVAVEILEEVYGVSRDKIACIPHGIHDTPFIRPDLYKAKLGLERRPVLLTFGLLHRKKGIEYMIDAMPAIVKKHPRAIYIVLGATHPNTLGDEGDTYRFSLEKRVDELGLGENVLFDNRFVELDELQDFMGACDILVTPYTRLDHITSGVLPYAMGKGRAVVSTPYWHAQELLDDGRGRLVPVRDSNALKCEIVSLLGDASVLSEMHEKAYAYSRKTIWSAISRDYLRLFDEVHSSANRIIPIVSSKLPRFASTRVSAFGNKEALAQNEFQPAKRKTAISSTFGRQPQ